MLRVTLGVVVRIFYRRIHLVGEEKIPSGSPVILASAHPNSFLDGVMLMYLLRRRIFTMARGDAFLKPRSNRILRSLGLLPIFRATDADPRESVKRNSEAFDETYELLKRDLAIIIFPEAIATPEKRVRPIRKGTARMAVDMVKRSDFMLDLHIVPIGMNYTFFGAPRKDLMIQIGDPISLLEHKEAIGEQEARFVNTLTKRIESDLEGLMICAPTDHDSELDLALELVRREFPSDPLIQFDRSSSQFKLEKQVSERFQDPGLLSDLTGKVREYARDRARLGLKEFERYNAPKRAFHAVFFIVTLLPALLAGSTHGWTLSYAVRSTPGRIKHELFHDSVIVGILLVGIYIMALIFFPIAFVLYSWGGILIYWMLRWLIPVYYQDVEIWKNFVRRRAWIAKSKKDPGVMSELERKRKDLIRSLIPLNE